MVIAEEVMSLEIRLIRALLAFPSRARGRTLHRCNPHDIWESLKTFCSYKRGELLAALQASGRRGRRA